MDKTLHNKQIGIRNAANRLLIFFSVLLVVSCTDDTSQVRIMFVGDVLLSRNVRKEYQYRKSFPWDSLQHFFGRADLVIANLEGSVGVDNSSYSGDSALPVFQIDSLDVGLLQRAGFDAVTVENNHSYDLGKLSKQTTVSTIKSFGLNAVSFETSPYFFSIKNVVIAIVAVNLVPDKQGRRHEIPSLQIQQKMRLARLLSNVVIVSVHWGSELLDWPTSSQRRQAKWFVANGADVVIGSHPHVVQMPELIDGKPVFFSLGNHLFDQKYPETKSGLIADLLIEDGKIHYSAVRTKNQKNSFYPQIEEKIDLPFEPVCFHSDLFDINNLNIVPVTQLVGGRIELQAVKNGKILWKTHPLDLVSIDIIRPDTSNYLLTLERHYSSIDGETNLRPYVYHVDYEGIVARWRGSALAWPLIDAQVSPHDNSVLCALHRSDSFIAPNKKATKGRVAAYKWNGFGFAGISDTIVCHFCSGIFSETP